MSTLSQFVAPTVNATSVNTTTYTLNNSSQVASVQSVLVQAAGITTSGAVSGEENWRYIDVTVSAVNISKTLVDAGSIFHHYYSGGVWYYPTGPVSARLTSTTNLRVSTGSNASFWGTVYLYTFN